MLLSGNPIVLFFIKFGKPDIDLFTTRINKQLDRHVSWHPETRGNGYQCLPPYLEQQWFLHVPPFSLVGWILLTINSNQGNNTTENYLHIASLIIILNKIGILFWKYMSCIRLWCIRWCISHVIDFLSGIFDEGHVMLTVQLIVQFVQ